jgi:mono/diheme cytochrome c family protein
MGKAVIRALACAVAFTGAMICEQYKGDADKGNEIFDEQCSSCHDAFSTERKAGPGLKWLFSKEKLDSNGKPVTEANVLEKLNTGGKGMPSFKETLSAEDKADVIAYLKKL